MTYFFHCTLGAIHDTDQRLVARYYLLHNIRSGMTIVLFTFVPIGVSYLYSTHHETPIIPNHSVLIY